MLVMLSKNPAIIGESKYCEEDDSCTRQICIIIFPGLRRLSIKA